MPWATARTADEWETRGQVVPSSEAAPERAVSSLAYGVRYISAMAQPVKSVLQVDDEAELLEPLRMSLLGNGIEVDTAGFCA